MITVGAADEKIEMLWDKFDEGAREAGKDPAGKPKLLQIHLSWAPDRRGGASPTRCANGRTAGWPSPSRTSRTRRTSPRWRSWSGPRTSRTGCSCRPSLAAQTENIQHYVDMGFDEIYLHNVGRNQAEFIDVFGREVLPNLRLSADRAHERRRRRPSTGRRRGDALARDAADPLSALRDRFLLPGRTGRSRRTAGDLPRRPVARPPAAVGARGRRGGARPLGACSASTAGSRPTGRGSPTTTRCASRWPASSARDRPRSRSSTR